MKLCMVKKIVQKGSLLSAWFRDYFEPIRSFLTFNNFTDWLTFLKAFNEQRMGPLAILFMTIIDPEYFAYVAMVTTVEAMTALEKLQRNMQVICVCMCVGKYFAFSCNSIDKALPQPIKPQLSYTR